jgi:hemolysin III
MFNTRYSNEPLSSATHFIATLLSIAGLSLLVTLSALRGTATHVVSFSIFGASLVLLYLFSALYHFLSKNHPAKDLFQILDHITIYILIAGTYTPLVLIVLPTAWGWSIFGAIWGLALCGVLIKASRLAIPVWIPCVLYLLMGWLIVIALIPLKNALPMEGILWLLAGGIFYTVGTIFFALDNLIKLQKWYTLHDIFHIFVMLGSFSHFWFMLKFVLPDY